MNRRESLLSRAGTRDLMTDGLWVFIRYRAFYDVPRCLVFNHGGRMYYLYCEFLDETEDYSKDYKVFLLPPEAARQVEEPSWEGLEDRGIFIGTFPVALARFDETRRRLIDVGVLYDWLSGPEGKKSGGTDGRRFSSFTEKVLSDAGWFPGREVSPRLWAKWKGDLVYEDGFTLFPAAERALREFGGLKVDQSSPGVRFARESFEIDPLNPAGETGRFEAFAEEIGEKLFPLGIAVSGEAFLAISESGRVFLLMMEISCIGNSIEEGLTRLVEGR